jgi:O-antigen ligase
VVAPLDLSAAALAVSSLLLLASATRTASTAVPRSVLPRGLVPLVALLVLAIGAATIAAPDKASAVFGAAGGALGLIQLVTLLGLGAASAVVSLDVRRVLEMGAPWLIGVQTASAVAQLLAGHEGVGTLSNTTYLSMTLLLCIPAVLSPLTRADFRKPLDRAALARLTLCIGAVVVMGVAGARTGAVLGAAAIAWAITPGVRSRVGGDRSATKVAVVALAACVAAVVLALSVRSGEALGTRPEMWTSTLRIIAARPLFGVGPDGLRTALQAIAPASMIVREGSGNAGFGLLPTDPHNVLLGLAASLGIVGLLAAASLFAGVVRTWIAQRRESGRLPWPAVSGLLYLGATMLAPAILQTLPLAAVVFGASVRTEQGSAGDAPKPRRRLEAAIVAVSVLACMVTLAQASTRIWVGPIASPDPGASRAVVAARLWSGDPLAHYVAAVRLSDAAGDSDQALHRAAIAQARRAAELSPLDGIYAAALADVLAGSGDVPGALEAYSRAQVLFPNSPDASQGRAGMLLSLGRVADARVEVQRALALAPARASVHELAAGIYAASGDLEGAATEREAAARLAR